MPDIDGENDDNYATGTSKCCGAGVWDDVEICSNCKDHAEREPVCPTHESDECDCECGDDE